MDIEPIDATLGAVITGVRLAGLTDDEWLEVEHAFHEHAVLVFPGQDLTSPDQISFAQRFGPIEVLVDGYDAVPISTVDRTGEVMAPDHPVMQVVRGNQGWHTDSTYMSVSAKASVLSARGRADRREARPNGPTCAPPTTRSTTRREDQISGLCAYHSIVYSQAKAGFDSTVGYGMDESPQLRPLVKIHSVTGRPALFIGRHAHAIPGLDPRPSPTRCSTRLLDDACRPPRVHRHHWQPGDVVVWDNRCVLHRACEWDLAEPRVMVHTRVAGDPATESAIAHA